MKIYSLGYQGSDVKNFTETLLTNDVGVVIDVREVAWSFKRNFAKTALGNYLSNAGIDYIHVKAAGNPSANRKNSSSAEECLRNYRAYLRDNPQCLYELLQHLRQVYTDGKYACFICYEHLPSDCHRSILLEFLKVMDKNITVEHLYAHCCLEATL